MNESSKTTLQVFHFFVKNISLCVDLKYVKKVLPLVSLEMIPGSPPYFAGLMNLAGKSVSVIDLSMRLGLTRKQSYSLDTPILLLADESQELGIIVDNILGLVEVSEEMLQTHHEFNKPDSPFLAVINLKNELSLFLDAKYVITSSLRLDNTVFTFDKAGFEYE